MSPIITATGARSISARPAGAAPAAAGAAAGQGGGPLPGVLPQRRLPRQHRLQLRRRQPQPGLAPHRWVHNAPAKPWLAPYRTVWRLLARTAWRFIPNHQAPPAWCADPRLQVGNQAGMAAIVSQCHTEGTVISRSQLSVAWCMSNGRHAVGKACSIWNTVVPVRQLVTQLWPVSKFRQTERLQMSNQLLSRHLTERPS